MFREIEFGSCIQYSREEKSKFFSSQKNILWDKMPIKWIVLDEQEDKMLLLSKECLYFEPFNDWFTTSAGNITWNECTLRQKMNKGIQWFTGAEYDKILDTEIESGKDKLFILSSYEINRYITEKEIRRAKPTEKAVMGLKEKGAFALEQEDTCNWWIRDKSADNPLKCMCIRRDGSLNKQGEFFNAKAIGVRPAMWIKNV